MQKREDGDQSELSEESYPSWQEYFPKQPHNQPNHLLIINQTIFSDLGITLPPEAFAQINNRNNQDEEDEEDQNSSLEYGYQYSQYQMDNQPSDYDFTPAEDIDQDQDEYQLQYSQIHSNHIESEQQSSFNPTHNPFTRKQPINTAMSQQQIALLPVMPWTDSNPTEQCSVCMQPFEKGQILRVMPCLHRNHTHCIDPWLTTNATCPSCRAITK